MTDKDRLIELLDDFGDDISLCDVCHRPSEDCEACKNEQLAEFLIANGVTVNEWISVEEKLPDTDGNVLVICNGEYKNIRFINAYDLAAYDSDEDEWILDSYPEAVVTVTHWMPLPKPPKEVDNGKID